MAKLNDLPREIVSLICSLLKQSATYHCIFVNRDFHDAAIPELWREPLVLTTATLKKLIKCLKISKQPKGDYIRVIKLGYTVLINDDELLSLIQLMPNLEVLELHNAEELTDNSIMRVSQYCSQLKSFEITGSLMTYRSAHYLGRCEHLQKLKLGSCPNLSAISLLPFSELNIKSLDLSGCKWLNVTDTAYDLARFQHLTHLHLVCCDIINMDFLHHITSTEGKPCLPYLQEFSITGNTIIDDHAVIPFIKTHTNLRGLFLLECAITDATLDTICSYLPSLHSLDLSFCRRLTATGIRHLIIHSPNLGLLGLKNCGITRSDFPEIPNSLFSAIRENYPHLNTLGYSELVYIREHNETDGSNHSHHINELVEDPEMAEDETVVMDDEDSVSENYAYIQQYLDSEIV